MPRSLDTSCFDLCLVEAAEELPLWVTRGFERIASLGDDSARLRACQDLPDDKKLLYGDFEPALNFNFPLAVGENVGASKLLQALHAIISFLQAGKEPASKDLLAALYDTYWIIDAFVRLKPLLKGGIKDDDPLRVLHSSLFTFFASEAAPPRFRLTTLPQVTLMRRCMELLRYKLRPLHNPYQDSLAVEYAVKHWSAHWLDAVALEEPSLTEECIHSLYDLIKGEDAADGQSKRDDPRLPKSEQRGGFASWAETHYKLQQAPGSNMGSPTWTKAREISQACSRIAQTASSLSVEAAHCKRVLDEYATLAQRIEVLPSLWQDEHGKPCSGDGGVSFWFSLLAAAPRTSLLFQQFSRQRASPRIDPLPAYWKPAILSRIALSTQQKNEAALKDLLAPPALRLKSSHEKGARDVLFNLSGQTLLVLCLEPDRFLFIDADETSQKGWIISLDQDEPAHQLAHETEKPEAAASSSRDEEWRYDPLGDLQSESEYVPREEGVGSLLARIVTTNQQGEDAQVVSGSASRPAATSHGYAQKLQAVRPRQVKAASHEQQVWSPLEISLPTAMPFAPDSAQSVLHAASLSPWRLIGELCCKAPWLETLLR